MAEGYEVEPGQLRVHAQNIAAIRDRFEAIKAASAHIAQDDSAYGLLCGWISGVLEGKHTRQDELFASVEENLVLVEEALIASADDYEGSDVANAEMITSSGGER